MRRALTILLWLFVAAAIGTSLVKRLLPTPESNLPVSGDACSVNEKAGLPAGERLVVCYFHTKTRCWQCDEVQAGARDAIRQGFPRQCELGEIEWREVDYTEPGNEHFAKQYRLVAPSIVLIKFRAGREKAWKALPEVWNLTADHRSLVQYVEHEIRSFEASP